MKKIEVKGIKINSIRSKIILIVLTTVVFLSVTLGVISCLLIYETVEKSLSVTMIAAAGIASDRVEAELESYRNIASETGMISKLSDEKTDKDTKQDIMSSRVANYGLQDMYLIGSDGLAMDGSDSSNKDYFKAAMAGETYISDPVIDNENGIYRIFISAPIWKDGIEGGEVVGVVCIVPRKSFLNEIVSSIAVGNSDSAYILDSSGLTIAYGEEGYVGVENAQELAKTDKSFEELAAVEKRMIDGETGFGSYSYEGDMEYSAFSPIEGTNGWSISISAYQEEFLSGVYKSVEFIAAACIMFIILGIGVSLWLSKKISDPIKACARRLDLMSHGDLTSEVPKSVSNDETSILLNSLSATIFKINMAIEDVAFHLGQIEQGNLSHDFQNEYEGDFSKLKMSTEGIMAYLNEDIAKISETSGQVSSGSEQVAGGAQVLSQGTAEQASSVEELSATMSEISDNVSSNAQNSEFVRIQTEELRNEIMSSSNKMREMVEAMSRINNSSNKIGKIIKEIEDIAFQTNILALNAAIEAARAGEAGKGFSVVADEVGNLASKSSSSANDTTILIQDSLSAVKDGMKIADETMETLMTLVKNSENFIRAVEEIVRSTEEQAVSIKQAATGIEQISSVVQTNSATAEESAAASQELSMQARLLQELVGKYVLKERSSVI
ncbi:MAG: methyl-accepting chemotaxis protein [Sedimentibacter sp.]|uniref:methyl-accepting chemotaxis protein n=1 Tax=Sedimentibacter sp. TaxID=1960295 RepID=UPI0031584977